MYLTAGILNTNVCGYHPLTYLFNVYKLNRNSISGNVFNIIQAAYGFLSIFSYQYKELEMNPPFLFMALTFEARRCETIGLSQMIWK